MIPEENYIPEEEIIPPPVKKLNPEQKKKISLVIQILLVTVLLLTISYYFYYFFTNINRGVGTNEITPQVLSPTPIKIIKFSKWATNSAVLQEEGNLENQESKIKSYDLNEPDLTFPSLDFNLNFNGNQ